MPNAEAKSKTFVVRGIFMGEFLFHRGARLEARVSTAM